ncbi:MAG: hypothetical protein VX438_09685, partial [Planctomycetota bacterium]|nr:hypothetical protein [Planctomycetota bacterium]
MSQGRWIPDPIRSKPQKQRTGPSSGCCIVDFTQEINARHETGNLRENLDLSGHLVRRRILLRNTKKP